MDDVTRECLAAVVDTSISGKRVAREFAHLVIVYGKPTTIVSDNREAIRRRYVSEADTGTDLTSNAALSWAGGTGIDWHTIAQGGVVP